MRPIILVLSSLLVSVSMAAAQSSQPDACSLLTPAEIKAAVGIDVARMAVNPKMNPAAGVLCDFEFPNAGAGGIAIRQLRAGETSEKVMAELGQQKIKTADAPGIGAPSFFAYPGYGMVQLNSFKGTTHLMLQLMVFAKPQDAVQAAAVKLMRSALARVK
jgi:hypothetical protein